MWTAWTTSVTLAIAMGGLFFKGPSWDHYAIGVVILGLTVLVALLRDRASTGVFRMSEATPPVAQHEGDERALQKMAALQRRVGERRTGHSWCLRFPG